MESKILLESGTNELELLIFSIGDTSYGVNVAKVREIIEFKNVTQMPCVEEFIEGTFKLRDSVYTLINLKKFFKIQDLPDHNLSDDQTRKIIIVIELNKFCAGILVDGVDGIHRMFWQDIRPATQLITNKNVPIVGVTLIKDKTIMIIDLESIVADALGVEPISKVQNFVVSDERLINSRIVLVEDSEHLRKLTINVLNSSGYRNIIQFNNGQDAWNYLSAHANDPQGSCELVLSDIEMPKMDGLHLTKKIKEDPLLSKIPVILFSSLITPDNFKKGQIVGADFQISKPDSLGILRAISSCLNGHKTPL